MTLKTILAIWQKKTDLVKLQYAYAVILILSLVLAGLVGLLNQQAAWSILTVSWITAVAFFVNLIAWALVNLFDTQVVTQAKSRTRK